jgi:prepilin-type N-terminal cleavage/methylation domain-containing protein
MSFNNINTKLRQERGFTIVELLIVIVVIGILAAITIVSFNGVTARANTANASSAAEAAIKKAEAYNAETGAYPTTPGALTGAAATTTYQLTGVVFNTVGTTGTSQFTTPVAPTSANIINFYNCGAGNGARFDYWKFDGTTGWQTMYTGGATNTNCPPTAFVKGP